MKTKLEKMLNKTTNLLYATITAKYKYYEKHRKKQTKKQKMAQ